MKKILVLAVVCAAMFALPLAAQQADSDEEGLTYINVNVYKVYDHKDAYIVVYGKNNNKTATVVIPKAWAIQQPRKLEFRKMIAPVNQPFMTVFYRGANFARVFLTLPSDRRRSVWAAAPYADVQSELDKESLTIVLD
jgi:hypothetical protein